MAPSSNLPKSFCTTLCIDFDLQFVMQKIHYENHHLQKFCSSDSEKRSFVLFSSLIWPLSFLRFCPLRLANHKLPSRGAGISAVSHERMYFNYCIKTRLERCFKLFQKRYFIYRAVRSNDE